MKLLPQSALSVEKIIEMIVQKCLKHFHIEQCAVMLLDRNEESSDFHTMIRKADESKIDIPYRLDSQLTGWMIINKKSLLVNDIKTDQRFNITPDISVKIRSFLAVPLLTKGILTGIIGVFNKKDKMDFTGSDERLLSIIASQSASVIDNARLLEDHQALIALQEELKHAAQIQKNLLPKTLPELKDYQIYAINIPAKEVGGDYYDFIKIGENKIAFCLGDVSGKGLSAALLMANLQATLRSQIFFDLPCCETVQRANLLLNQSTDGTQFVTLFIGVIDLMSNKIKFCNAGHNYPILITADGNIKRLEEGGLLLGCLTESTYKEASVELNAGDLLCIFTDGISEAMNSDRVEFSEEKILDLVKEFSHLNPEQISRKILGSVRIHVDDEPQSDDITLLLIKRI